MSQGKVKILKQEPEGMDIGEHEMAVKIRQRSSYTNDLETLKSWVLNQDSTIVDGQICPTMKIFTAKFDPNKPTNNLVPEELKNFFAYMLEEYRIPLSEVRAYQVQCIKPMSSYSLVDKKNTKEIVIKQCLANTSDRFVFFGGSKEFLHYRIINIDQLRKAAKLPPNAYIPKEFTEQVSQNCMLHMDLVTAISNRLVVDNKGSYMRPDRPGFRKGFSISKQPEKRWIVVLDILATAEKFDTVLAEKLEMIGHIVGAKPDSKEAKMIKSFKEVADSSKLSTIVESNEEDTPLLVEVPETEDQGSQQKDDDDDVEEIVIDSVSKEVLDLL